MKGHKPKTFNEKKASIPFQEILAPILYPSPDNNQNKNISGSEKVASFTRGFEKTAKVMRLGLKPSSVPARITPTGVSPGGAVHGLKNLTGAKASVFPAAPKFGMKPAGT